MPFCVMEIAYIIHYPRLGKRNTSASEGLEEWGHIKLLSLGD